MPENIDAKRVRTFFWCGLIIGALAGFTIALWISESLWIGLSIVIVTALAMGAASAQLGDRFWEWLAKYSWWI